MGVGAEKVSDGGPFAARIRQRVAKVPPLARDAVLVGVLIPAGLLQQDRKSVV